MKTYAQLHKEMIPARVVTVNGQSYSRDTNKQENMVHQKVPNSDLYMCNGFIGLH